MSILLAIPAICFLGFLAIILALRKKWLAALVFLTAAAILNSATQQIPVRFGKSRDSIDTTGTTKFSPDTRSSSCAAFTHCLMVAWAISLICIPSRTSSNIPTKTAKM